MKDPLCALGPLNPDDYISRDLAERLERKLIVVSAELIGENETLRTKLEGILLPLIEAYEADRETFIEDLF